MMLLANTCAWNNVGEEQYIYSIQQSQMTDNYLTVSSEETYLLDLYYTISITGCMLVADRVAHVVCL
jgi:hypothetical protein